MAALLCGVVCVVDVCLAWVSLPAGVTAVVLGILGARMAAERDGRVGMAWAGIILGTVGVVSTVLLSVAMATLATDPSCTTVFEPVRLVECEQTFTFP